jgi:hypothetical protein
MSDQLIRRKLAKSGIETVGAQDLCKIIKKYTLVGVVQHQFCTQH